MKKLFVAIFVFFLAVPCIATTRLMKLKEDRYLITHQKQTGFGGQGKAIRKNYEKAGSLCVILGYDWFEIKETQSKGRGFGSAAAATMEVKFYKGDPAQAKGVEEDELFDCQELASEEQKEKMQKALRKMKK